MSVYAMPESDLSGANPGAPELSMERVFKYFGSAAALKGIDLVVPAGDLWALLGPSGCGKTTALRILAGLDVPSEGRVLLRGRDITGVPAHRRDTAMVFQSYALFPHLTVSENIAYGLRRHHVRGAKLRARVGELLGKLGIEDLAARRPVGLSGGQQQRVAIARALAVEPSILLLDEPFSALDAKLREQTRVELRRLQREIGITTVFVTHDQQEALSISDGVVVMNAGRIEQVGAPQQVYENPSSRFVASFLGAANLLEGSVDGSDLVTPSGLRFQIPSPGPDSTQAVAAIRKEDLVLGPDGAHDATVEVMSYLGDAADAQIRLRTGEALTVRGPRELAAQFPAGTRTRVGWSQEAVQIFPR